MENKISIVYIGSYPDLIGKLKANEGLTVEVLPNALIAINYMNSGNKPDAILCESHVLGGSAFEVFNILKNKNQLDHIAFILVAFEFKKEVFLEAFKSGIDDYYVLPEPEPEALLGRISFLKENKNKVETNEKQVVSIPTLKIPLSKRIFDVIVASFALLVLSPLFLIVMLAIRIESKGKVYYTSRRYGRYPFDFYKLRSMRTGADALIDKELMKKNQYSNIDKPAEFETTFQCPNCKWVNGEIDEPCSPLISIGLVEKVHICEFWYYFQKELSSEIKSKERIDEKKPCPKCEILGTECSARLSIVVKDDTCSAWYYFQKKVLKNSEGIFMKILNDPRITKVGKFIRNTSIDELPQLVNVLHGDMSIVGNRPLPIKEAEKLLKDSNSKRFLAPAGITGLWQVELRGKGGVMSEKERNDLDNAYADLFINKKYTLWYDIKLILRTIPALFQKGSV